ncbi:cholinesterase-like isoform X2 [Elgaria multicarinata webbii]|uniref:cholinesterase-like isoform X2 n=1 Tax=Elgaria multicarinata webbii TaxID=159646 RepID=UPI002FCCB8F8
MPHLLLPFFGLFFFLSLTSTSASENDTMVVTSSGPIKGKRVLTGAGSVTAYLGIPYAEPPLGKLRFQKPRLHRPWNSVLEVTKFGNSCPQTNISGFPNAEIWAANTPLSEDCLFLNIWVPHPPPLGSMPILVWFQGMGFITGTASLDIYNGALLAATENVIVASINYRLGALGFLYMPPDAPGNVGLWDQWLALKWLKANADVFGSQANQLTLVGHSAGAAMVGFHLLSPVSNPLFARAVLQSGVPNAIWPWKSPQEAKLDAVMLSGLVGCANDSQSAVISCLQDIEIGGQAFSHFNTINSLTIDGEFLPDEPQKLLETIPFRGKPILTGITADEGSPYVLLMYPETKENGGILTWEQLLKGVMGTMKKGTKKHVAKAVALKFSEGYQGPERYRLAFAQYFRDYFFLCAMDEFAAKMRETKIQTFYYRPDIFSVVYEDMETPVYVYSFDHRTSGSEWPAWVQTPYGVEIPYLFGSLASVLPRNESAKPSEVALSRQVMRYWAEFARSGKPTPSTNKVQWPVYDATEKKVFCISTDAPQVKHPSPAPHCDFLDGLRVTAIRTKNSEEDTA